MTGACEVCGTWGTLHGHHIYFRSEASFLKRVKLNIVSICVPCHEDAHSFKQQFREKLRGLYPDRMKELDEKFKTEGKVNELRRLA